MAGLWYGGDRPAYFTAAGGEASLGQIFEASRDAALLVDNTIAAATAMDAAFDRRIDNVFAATGMRLEHPMRRGMPDQDELVAFQASGEANLYFYRKAQFERDLRDLASRYPAEAARGALTPFESVEDEALSISREAEERFGTLSGSRGGAAKWLAVLAGGIAGAARDPIQVATWALGGGPGGARTVAGRIFATMASEAAVNAGVELALQPIVQKYRAKAGLDAGIDEALKNAAFAGLLGGLLGGAGRSVVELLTFGGRTAPKAASVARAELPAADPARQAIEAEIAQAAATVRGILGPEERGAIDAAEGLAFVDESLPAAAAAEIHDINVSRAQEAAEAPEPAMPHYEADAGQVMRLADEITGAPPPAEKQPQSLVDFLIDAGGIADWQGELRRLDAGAVSRRFRGRLINPGGRALDAARELAEEAGYIGIAGDMQVTRVADLLDAIERELRGNPVYARGDESRVAISRDWDEARARVESTIAEVAAIAGPAVDDAIVMRAARAVLDDGADPFDAVERAIVAAEPSREGAWRIEADGRVESRVDPLPGWSDAELEAASLSRGTEPDAAAGLIDNPAEALTAEAGELAAAVEEHGAMLVPDDTGQLVPFADMVDSVRRLDDMAALVKACRT